MHMLKDERLAQHQPTQYPTSEVSMSETFEAVRRPASGLVTIANSMGGEGGDDLTRPATKGGGVASGIDIAAAYMTAQPRSRPISPSTPLPVAALCSDLSRASPPSRDV